MQDLLYFLIVFVLYQSPNVKKNQHTTSRRLNITVFAAFFSIPFACATSHKHHESAIPKRGANDSGNIVFYTSAGAGALQSRKTLRGM